MSDYKEEIMSQPTQSIEGQSPFDAIRHEDEQGEYGVLGGMERKVGITDDILLLRDLLALWPCAQG